MKKLMKDFYKKVAINKNQNGFSLVEIMVAAGMLGVVSLGVMRLTSNMSKSSKRLHQEAESMDLTYRIKSVLRNQDACTNTFTNTNMNLSTGGTAIAALRTGNNNVAFNLSGIVGMGTPGAVQITSAVLRGYRNPPPPPPAARTYSLTSTESETYGDGSGGTLRRGPADLIVNIRKSSNTAASDANMQSKTQGSLNKVLVIPVNVITDDSNNRIIGCYGDSAEYVAASCSALGGVIDGNGFCTEIHVRTGSGADAVANIAPAVTIGSTLSTEAGVGSHATTALKIIRSNNPLDPVSLILDDDEIQAVGLAAAPGNLKINEDGGTVVFGNADNIGVTINGTAGITGNTSIGDNSASDTLTVNAATTIGGTTIINAPTTINDNLTVIGNTILGDNQATDTLTVDANTTINGNSVTVGNSDTDTQTFRGATTFQGPTVAIGNSATADTITVTGTTILRGNSITIGDNTSDAVTVNGTTRLNGNNVFIGNANSDNVTIQGNTNLIGNDVNIGNANTDTIDLRGVVTLTPTPAGTAPNNRVPNLGTIREMMKNVLAPSTGEFAGVLADIVANSATNDTALNVQSEWTCDKIRIFRSNGTSVGNGGSGCNFDTPDLNTQINNCSVNGQCSRVCIAGDCRTAWPSSGITTNCNYVRFIYENADLGATNSNAATYVLANYNCGAGRAVAGIQRQHVRLGCGNHDRWSYLRCCLVQ